ncbi:MAG: phosphoribosylaminoimidazolesuccinocarboxamide synthase [Gemmatimonadaceae bacterium]|nr:phosphoribosylaminoimidazolesuccinocarboxamide synthase [Gemmatimonadaceae bacterium]
MFEARPTPIGVPTTRLPLFHAARGKVRDVYEVDDDRLLLVATDRVSAFDVVMREAVPVQGHGAHADSPLGGCDSWRRTYRIT